MQLLNSIILFELLLFIGFSTCNAGIYLAINALAYTEDNGNGDIIKRRLEVNWYGDEVYTIYIIKTCNLISAKIGHK